MPKNFTPPEPARTKQSATRGSRSQRVTLARVEGEVLTIKEIAARLSCSTDRASAAVHHLRRRNRPVTWETLRKASESP